MKAGDVTMLGKVVHEAEARVYNRLTDDINRKEGAGLSAERERDERHRFFYEVMHADYIDWEA
jgi:hypothetical protein